MDERNHQIAVELSHPGERLDVYLRTCFPAVSRGTFKRLIEETHVKVNGKPAKLTYSPRAGDQITVHFPEARPTQLKPMDIPLDVLFEDEDLLVLNKPAGLLVHPASGEEERTLVRRRLARVQPSRESGARNRDEEEDDDGGRLPATDRGRTAGHGVSSSSALEGAC